MESVPVTHMWCSIVPLPISAAPKPLHADKSTTLEQMKISEVQEAPYSNSSPPDFFIAPALHYEVRTLRVPLAAALRNSSEDAAR